MVRFHDLRALVQPEGFYDSKKFSLSSHFILLPSNFRKHSLLSVSEVAPDDQSLCRNHMRNAILGKWSPSTHLGTNYTVATSGSKLPVHSLGKIPQMLQPGVVDHPSTYSQARKQLKPGQSEGWGWSPLLAATEDPPDVLMSYLIL